MNRKTQQDAVDIIESRFLAVTEKGLTCCLQREIEMAVDMAGLFGAIDSIEQRHFKERLNKLIAAEHEQWLITNRRIG